MTASIFTTRTATTVEGNATAHFMLRAGATNAQSQPLASDQATLDLVTQIQGSAPLIVLITGDYVDRNSGRVTYPPTLRVMCALYDADGSETTTVFMELTSQVPMTADSDFADSADVGRWLGDTLDADKTSQRFTSTDYCDTPVWIRHILTSNGFYPTGYGATRCLVPDGGAETYINMFPCYPMVSESGLEGLPIIAVAPHTGTR